MQRDESTSEEALPTKRPLVEPLCWARKSIHSIITKIFQDTFYCLRTSSFRRYRTQVKLRFKTGPVPKDRVFGCLLAEICT